MRTKPDPFDSLGLSIVQRMSEPAGMGRVLLVTSARPGEGKTFVAQRLAQRFVGLMEGPVLLVDANVDGRRPKSAPRPDTEEGLFACLAAGEYQQGHIQLTATPGLSLMPSPGTANSSLLFHMNALRRVLDVLRSQFALTVLDAGTLANAGCLAQQADGSVVVVDASRTRRDVVQGALESPHIDRGRILGVVLNRRPEYVPQWLYRSVL